MLLFLPAPACPLDMLFNLPSQYISLRIVFGGRSCVRAYVCVVRRKKIKRVQRKEKEKKNLGIYPGRLWEYASLLQY